MTEIPKQLDANFEKLDSSNSVRPTILGELVWVGVGEVKVGMVFMVVITLCLEEVVLGWVSNLFKYFFMFTPTWGRSPF